MDRQGRLRSLLYLSVVGLAIMALIEPSTASTARAAILVPLLFIGGAAFLLGLPFLAMQHAEGGPIPWRRALDFLEHNSVLAFLDLMILWTTAFVAGLGWTSMSATSQILFVGLVAIGMLAAVGDWALSQQNDDAQAKWQEHPR